MLEPITKKMTDESDGNAYRFIFHCDACGHPWHSFSYSADADSGFGDGDVQRQDSGYNAAYERANQEAIRHFNRCPVCKRMVCDDCIMILDEVDLCKECAIRREDDAWEQPQGVADFAATGLPETQGTESKAAGLSRLRRLFGMRNTGRPQEKSKTD